MVKFVDTMITFSEFPDEISLCINISNCPCFCAGCHSPYLSEDVGTLLTMRKLKELIEKNEGITCIGFMGGDAEPHYINTLAKQVKETTDLKVGWYSGRSELPKEIDLQWFDFIKLGPYIEQFGPLNNPNTNQKFFKIKIINNKPVVVWNTNLFWNGNISNKKH